MSEQDVERVAAGYDAVYAAMPYSATLARIWRTHALGDDYPPGFEHISFLTFDEMRRMSAALELTPGATLVDLACGMGGPGLWIAREAGARLIGLDISPVAIAGARGRAEALHLVSSARFDVGSFASTGLDQASADGVMSVDALQYAPDKQAAFDEAARILRPGGRLAFACFELDPDRVAGLPVLGTDPVADYRPLLQRAGFEVLVYEETPGWNERLTNAYQAIIDAQAALTQEMGDAGYAALSGEVAVTLQLQPYRRRVFAAAARR